MQWAGDVLTTPVLYIVGDGVIETPCGQIGGYAGFYCSSNQAIYMVRKYSETRYNSDGWLSYGVERTFAHEFGHHVQAMTGLMWASWTVQFQLSGEEALLENRRRELQAQCISGLSFASLGRGLGLTESDRDLFWYGEHRWADNTHGTSEHQAQWFWQGFNNLAISSCNTWNAPPADLS